MNIIFFKLIALICVFGLGVCQKNDTKFTPIVMWHGMGDSCCFPFSLGRIQDQLNETLPGVHVLSLQIGSSLVSDVENGYFMHPDKQMTEACDIIKSDPELANGFNAIGFSQGAQFLRALVQRCSAAQVKNLISLGGQHQGVYGLPNCGSLSNSTCDYIRQLLNHAAYISWVQKMLVQATYWHDPLNEEEYRNHSSFLSDINNELTVNEDYVKNLLNLDNFVLVKFENDTMVEPVESEWFGFYKSGQSEIIEDLRSSSIYKEDRLGLKRLDDASKLHFLATPGRHLQFDWEWFEKNIIDPYLRN